jgi:hypothetical protein
MLRVPWTPWQRAAKWKVLTMSEDPRCWLVRLRMYLNDFLSGIAVRLSVIRPVVQP